MKQLPLILSVLSLAGVIFIISTHFTGHKGSGDSGSATAGSALPAMGKLAYVNVDSFEEHYELLKSKSEEFKTRRDQMENELQRSYQEMQNDAEEVQKKMQAQTLTQAEYEAAQKRLGIKQQTLESRKQTLSDQLMKDQEEFNRGLKKSLDEFLEDYNKTKHYDYIFSYTAAGGSALLYANKGYDITQDVITGMNQKAKSK